MTVLHIGDLMTVLTFILRMEQKRPVFSGVEGKSRTVR